MKKKRIKKREKEKKSSIPTWLRSVCFRFSNSFFLSPPVFLHGIPASIFLSFPYGILVSIFLPFSRGVSFCFPFGKIAEFIPKLSRLAQFRLSTIKTSDSVPELSKSGQLHLFADVAHHVGSPSHRPVSLGCKIPFYPP